MSHMDDLNTAGHATDLLDVSELSLRDLDSLGDQEQTPIGHALRRILNDSDSASVAGFTSFI